MRILQINYQLEATELILQLSPKDIKDLLGEIPDYDGVDVFKWRTDINTPAHATLVPMPDADPSRYRGYRTHAGVMPPRTLVLRIGDEYTDAFNPTMDPEQNRTYEYVGQCQGKYAWRKDNNEIVLLDAKGVDDANRKLVGMYVKNNCE